MLMTLALFACAKDAQDDTNVVELTRFEKEIFVSEAPVAESGTRLTRSGLFKFLTSAARPRFP